MKSTFRIASLSFSLLAVAALGVCASSLNTAGTSDFACDRSKTCPTPLEVYSDTHSTPGSVMDGRTPESWKAGDGKKVNKQLQALRADLLNLGSEGEFNVAGEPGARPLREASQVMRIWVAPWVDGQDNLNWSGYVYTEVTPKRWSYGEQEVRHQSASPAFLPR